jgi:hypothetical protein
MIEPWMREQFEQLTIFPGPASSRADVRSWRLQPLIVDERTSAYLTFDQAATGSSATTIEATRSTASTCDRSKYRGSHLAAHHEARELVRQRNLRAIRSRAAFPATRSRPTR